MKVIKPSNKHWAALSSVIAAVFLTGMKLTVGIITGSLGILSEAVHSALDLVAAVITLFAVRFSDKPPDPEHQYGHGKIESFSALVETLLLLLTCGWIIYEVIEKLFYGKEIAIIGSQWGIAVMAISIFIDYSRVKVLRRAAKEHGSQALEADALHFSSDVWSSSVVILGLAFVWAGDYFKIPALNYADPIAAFGVSLVVIRVSIKLGKETINVLLDTAPQGMRESILNMVSAINDVLEVADIRVRPSGATFFIDINVGVDRDESHQAVHAIVSKIQNTIHERIPRSDIIVSTFPVDVVGASEEGVYHTIKRIIDKIPNCTNIHNIHIYELGDKKKVAAHIELQENITLEESHELSHRINKLVQSELQDIDTVSTFFECANQKVMAEDITASSSELIEKINNLAKKVSSSISCHDIRLYRKDKVISTFLHCELCDNLTVDKLDLLSNNIIQELKNNIKSLENVHIHFEPKDVGD